MDPTSSDGGVPHGPARAEALRRLGIVTAGDLLFHVPHRYEDASTVTPIRSLEPGMHGTTFGGNPVACAAGAAVIQEIDDKGLMQRAAEMGRLLLEQLHALAKKFPGLICEVRGLGLMAGLELDREADPAVAAMRDRGILINGTDRTVLRFLPPLIVSSAEIDLTVQTLEEVLNSLK